MHGSPSLADMRWWSTRGKFATTKKVPHERLLKLCARWWGQAVIHVWDRGYGNESWLMEALPYPVRFVVCGAKSYRLKLLMMVALVYAFLLSLLAPHLEAIHPLVVL